MPTLEIHRDQPKPREIRMGQAPRVIEPEPEKAMAAAMPIPDEPPAPKTKNQGRVKKMADDKKLDHESGGPETIRKDDAGEQGAIGSHGQNAPAQEKVPQSDSDKEAQANG